MGSISDTQAQIPVIDISDANSQNAPKQLLDAATRFGFVFIKNNEGGIAPKLVSNLFDLSKEFFALPTEVKNEVSISSNKAGKNHGWLGQGVEKLDPGKQERPDVKEYDRPLHPLNKQQLMKGVQSLQHGSPRSSNRNL